MVCTKFTDRELNYPFPRSTEERKKINAIIDCLGEFESPVGENIDDVFTVTISQETGEPISKFLEPPTKLAGYNNVYFVRDLAGDDSTATANRLNSSYKTINAASNAARADADLNGHRNIVYVLRGTFNEKDIIRNHVYYFFEEGAVVWTSGSGNSVINDIVEILDDTEIQGLGTFVSADNEPSDDREGINIRRASKFKISGKLVDSMQVWGGSAVNLELENINFIFQDHWQNNKKGILRRCTFINGHRFSLYQNKNTSLEYYNCEFRVNPYPLQSVNNTSLNIYDWQGILLFRIVPTYLSGLQQDTSALADNNAVISDIMTNYTTGLVVTPPGSTGIFWSQNSTGNSLYKRDNSRILVKDSVVKIQRNKCIGIMVVKREDATVESMLELDNVVVVDEKKTTPSDATPDTCGYVQARTAGIGEMMLGLTSCSQNCVSASKTPATYNALARDFSGI